jgi:hypothetical protein
VFILGILAIGLIIAFYFFFGATYELVKCYYEKKDVEEENEEERSYDMINMDPNRSSPPIKRSSSILSSDGKKSTSHYLILTGLVMLGLILQPLYLMLKLVEMMMECFRKFGCWFYFYGAYN